MNVPAKLSLALVFLVLASTVASAQIAWPDFMSKIEPGSSASPVAAVPLADATVAQPAADVPSSKAKWSGHWSGWACRRKECDTKLVVEQVTAEGATIVYAFASADIPPYTTRVNAKFAGDELQATLNGGAWIAYRMRLDGNIEFMWQLASRWATGILSKER